MMKVGTIVGMCLALLLIAIAMMSCTTKGLDFEAGVEKFDARELDEAIAIFESIASEESKYTNRARYYMGQCYKLQFKWEEAEQQFQTVIDTEPPASYLASEARSRIAQIREGKDEIVRLDFIRKNFPGTDEAADALLELGSVYENKLNDYDSAMKAYRRLIEEFPGTGKAAQAQKNIGYIHFYRLYDYDGGWAEFQEVNEENYPELSYSVEEVRDLLRDMNKTLEEINEHRAFIKLSQKRKIPDGDYKITGYELYSVRQDQVAQSFIAIGKKWTYLKHYPNAIEAYRILIQRLPLMLSEVAQARYGLGAIYQEQGQFYEAIDAYEEYVKYHPTDYRREEAVYNMATCYDSLRQYEDAYDSYKAYRDSYPEGKFYTAAELKVRQYEYDEDQDGFSYYKELAAGTADTDPDAHP